MIENLRDVQHTGMGTAVRLKRRQRLLGTFYIHWAFGSEAGQLADAIRDEISRTNSRLAPKCTQVGCDGE